MPSTQFSDPIIRQSIDTIRLLAADAVEKAKSGTSWHANGGGAYCLPAV